MHLIVLQHGLWGNPSHLDPIIEQIKSSHPINDFLFLNVADSLGTLTYDGIDICGDRCIESINMLIANTEEVIDKVSFVGYSLGGLILRYVIGKLHSIRFFDDKIAMNYISIATPHLGTKRPPQHTSTRVFNVVQSTILTRLGPQLTTSDCYVNSLPLLVVMSNPRSQFYKGLALFKSIVLFANIHNDRSVPYTTASISRSNPYTKYKCKSIDSSYPSIVTFDNGDLIGQKAWTIGASGKAALKCLVLPILIPVWLIIATIGLTIIAARSLYRQKSLRLENDWVLFEEEVILESNDVQKQGNEGHYPVDCVDDQHTPELKIFDSVTLDQSNDFDRAKMIENLNSLKWTKFDVFIDVFNSHAAIVRRKPFPRALNDHSDTLVYLSEKVFLI